MMLHRVRFGRPIAQADNGGRVILSMSGRALAGSSKSRINLSFEL
jgi:hypothetical protein